jgi:hypothetical protein
MVAREKRGNMSNVGEYSSFLLLDRDQALVNFPGGWIVKERVEVRTSCSRDK